MSQRDDPRGQQSHHSTAVSLDGNEEKALITKKQNNPTLGVFLSSCHASVSQVRVSVPSLTLMVVYEFGVNALSDCVLKG